MMYGGIDDEEPERERGGGSKDEPGALREVIVTVVAALLLAYGVQALLVKPYRIPSGSMEHTLRCKDRVLVDRLTFHFGDPERGDVVVFEPPLRDISNFEVQETSSDTGIDIDQSGSGGEPDAPTELSAPDPDDPARGEQTYIKRVIGVPGDEIEMRAGVLYRNGERLEEPYLHPVEETDSYGPVRVPEGHYFVMGDNRTNSQDSRVFGSVPRDFIIGQAFMIYWPIRHIGPLPKAEQGGPGATEPNEDCLESATI